MKPLSHFLRAAPSCAPTLENQVAALEAASPEQIIATASSDGEDALRIAAVAKLHNGELLRALAGCGDRTALAVSTDLERAAQQRVAQLIDAGAIEITALCAAAANCAALLSVAELCGDSANLTAALSSIEDPQTIMRLAVEGASSRIRQLAAQRIADPAELKELLKQVRGKDKSVYRIIKQKCDVLHAEEQRIAQIDADTDALCASLERHGHRYYDPLYEPALRLLDAQWKTLEAMAAPEIRERVRLAVDRCREVIAAHQRQLAEQAAAQSQQAALRAARHEAAALAATDAERLREAEALAAAQAQALRAAEEKARAEQLAAEARALRQIGGLIAKANVALRDGKSGQAAGLRRAIESKLPALPAVPAHLAVQMQQLDAKLKELKEWKDYAVAPKRTALIEQMEALIGSSAAPKALAEQIKRLQEAWKTISKGIVSDSEADWQRFQRASATAYQPCREYFEAQAEQRRENLGKLQNVLDRLRAFEAAQSGEQPDWRAVMAVLREAPQEWRKHFPVDRAAGRAVQQEFDASIGRLHARLDAWHAQNVAEKRTLIERAQQLRESEDSRAATDAVKRLQLSWKEIGPAPRAQEQPLWDEFRKQCDAFFQKRQQAYADYAGSLESNKQRAVAICEEAERVAASSGTVLLEGAGKVAEWRSGFEALGELPRADQRGLHDRLERAIRRCQAGVLQQRARDKEQSYTNLLEAARRIQAYGCAVARNGAAAEREALKLTAETYIAGIAHWPKGGAQALKEAWTKSEAAAGLDLPAQDIALRTLCIRSEIHTETTTPPEDQGLRREYQVQRLVKSMGQRREANPEELDALALEWVHVGPASSATYESLLARFLRCRSGSP